MNDISRTEEDHVSGLDRYEIIEKEDFNALKVRYLELTSLFEINKILNSTLDLRSILDNVLLTPMGRLMISKGMVLLVSQPDTAKVENVKGMSSKYLGQCYSLGSLPQHAIMLEDMEDVQDRLYQAMQTFQMKILIPMIAGGKYLGLIAYGEKFCKEPFTQDEVDFLESIANLAAIAVNKSLLFEEISATNKKLDRRIQELNTLFEISRELNSSLDQSNVAQILSYAIMGELLINKCIILIETNGQFKVEVAKGIGEIEKGFDFSLCGKLMREQLRQDEHHFVLGENNLPNEYKEICKVLIEKGIEYLIPMVSKDDVKGVIGIGKKIIGQHVSEEELSFLEKLANDAIIAIDNANMVQHMLEKQRMDEELKIAWEIQSNLLPSQLPEIPGVQISGKNLSSYQVGGDYYDCIQLNDHLFGIAIADVSGKSTPAALLMANLQAILRSLANENRNISQTVSRINELIYQNTTVDKFITFFYCILDTEKRTITYTNAGHNPPYLIRGNETFLPLEKGGLILGLFPEAQYEYDTIQLQKDDTFFLYTDGLTEAMNNKEEEFGEKRLQHLLQQISHLSTDKIIQSIQNEISEFAGDVTQSDDITMVVAKAL